MLAWASAVYGAMSIVTAATLALEVLCVVRGMPGLPGGSASGAGKVPIE